MTPHRFTLSYSRYDYTRRYDGAFSRHARPEFCGHSPPGIGEGAGKAGSLPPPWPACGKNAGGRTTGTAEDIPAFPARWFERLIRALSGERLCCPRHRDARHAPRLSASTAAPRPHDFAVRTGSFVRMDNHAATRCAHRIPRSTSVTIAIRPCNEAGWAGSNHDFQKNARRMFSGRRLDKRTKSFGPK